MRHHKEGKIRKGAGKIAGEMEKSAYLAQGNPYITRSIAED